MILSTCRAIGKRYIGPILSFANLNRISASGLRGAQLAKDVEAQEQPLCLRHTMCRRHERLGIILDKLVKCEKDVQNIDVHSEAKNSVVFTMDGVYAENAGAIFCHLIGDEPIFQFAYRR